MKYLRSSMKYLKGNGVLKKEHEPPTNRGVSRSTIAHRGLVGHFLAQDKQDTEDTHSV